MTDIVYTTQLMVKSANDGEDIPSLYRRVQRHLWMRLAEEFQSNAKGGVSLQESLPYDKFFTERSWSVSNGTGVFASGRYLETDKIMTMGIRVRKRQPSAWVPEQSDNDLITDVCIEAPKVVHSMISGVCFSCKVSVQCQPFAGFFKRTRLPLVAPRLVTGFLKGEDWSFEFQPYGIGKFTPQCRYAVSEKPYEVKGGMEETEFLAKLKDIHRPVCLVVFMGGGHRQRREAKCISHYASTKAIVYVLNKSDSLITEMDRVVVGMNAAADFRRGRCRVFFPFGPGQYSQEEFANPNYRVPFFLVQGFRRHLLTGLLRYFDMRQPWRRDKRDVHLTELEWRQGMELKQKSEEATGNQALLNSILEKRKDERVQFERDREYLMSAATEAEAQRDSAMRENLRLSDENRKLRSGSRCADEINLSVDQFFKGEAKEHLLETIEFALPMLGDRRERRVQILKAVMKVNQKSGELERRRLAVENIFKGSSELSDGDFKELEKIGVSLNAANTHYKVKFGSLSIALSKTPGDWRVDRKRITEMNNKFF